jgi:PAS domain S-box-containing protein
MPKPHAVALLISVLLLLAWRAPFSATSTAVTSEEGQRGEPHPAHVLVLSSYHQGYSWTEQIIDGMLAAFADHDIPIEFSYEYLDTKRQQESPAYYRLHAELFAHKYRRHPVDLVLLSDNSSFDFIEIHRQNLFPDAPVVFCGLNNYSEAMHNRIPRSTGVAEYKEMGATLDLIRQLHPSTRTIAIISDQTGTGAIDAALVEQAVLERTSLERMVLSGEHLSLVELLERLRHLPPHTVVFFSSFWRDHTGQTYAADDTIPLIVQASSAPIYTHADTFLTGGFVGGVLVHGRTQGQLAGEMAVQILQGTPPESIPVSSQANTPIFDYEALVRWQIDEALLPANAVILNRPPPSLYERYTSLVWSIVAAFIILLTLIVVLVVNIAFRRRAETALRQSEERFRALIEMAPIPIILGRDNRYLYSNRAFARLFTSTVNGELDGRQLTDFLAAEERKAVTQYISYWTETRRNEPISFESIGYKLDGTRFPCAVNATTIKLSDGPCSLVFVQDISERRRAEEEQERLQSQLLHAQKMESVGRLAGGVAHDFNNMLGVILGYTELSMKHLESTDQLSANLQQIRVAAEHSADLTRQLLAFARRQTVIPRVIDLNEVVKGILKILSRLIGENIDLAWLPGNGLWPIKIDPTQIDQILANLCVNSRDAIAGNGRVTIETANLSASSDSFPVRSDIDSGDYVQLIVSDNGCGMDEKTVEKLFDPFFTTKEIGKGTGLGLAMVYGIVMQNNGHISVDSTPDQGTTFRILFPRHSSAAIPQEQHKRRITAVAGKETILLVEDEPKILDMTATLLELLGYKVMSAALPSEAIRRAEEHPGDIDLLITDVIMPEMNGWELAEKLQISRPALRRLFMSGYTADIMDTHGRFKGDINFIQKPFTGDDLSTAVREALEKQEISTRPGETAKAL